MPGAEKKQSTYSKNYLLLNTNPIMNIIFQIDGGLGKSVAATAVCKAIKKQYPDSRLIVVTGYPEVFACNPHVYKTINFGSQHYFYQDYIENTKDTLVFAHNPYIATDFIMERGHLIKVWCELFGITYNGEQPELFMSEIEFNRYSPSFASDKPIMVIQTNGGSVQHGLYSWVRDMPQATAQYVVNAFAKDYNIVHLKIKEQLSLQNVTPFQAANFRSLIALIAMSQKRLFIDSFAQHTAAAIGMPSVVCWIGNKPEQFGYAMHANIIGSHPTRQPDLRYSFYGRYNISGENPTESCYNNQNEIFNPDLIIDVVSKFPAPPQQQAPPAELHSGEAIAPPPADEATNTLKEEIKQEEKSKGKK